MRRALHALHATSAWLLVGALAVQAFLAGRAIVNLGGSGDFALHVEFGYTIVGLASLAVVLMAVTARSPRRDSLAAFAMLLLYFVQTALPALRATLPAVAALHLPTALLLFALATWYALRATRAARLSPAVPGHASGPAR